MIRRSEVGSKEYEWSVIDSQHALGMDLNGACSGTLWDIVARLVLLLWFATKGQDLWISDAEYVFAVCCALSGTCSLQRGASKGADQFGCAKFI
jgi:hypothetical protein